MANDEQLYKFVDVTGNCFESFQRMGKIQYTKEGKPYGDRIYHDQVGAMLRASNNDEHSFTVGDMMAFKDELLEAGFEWGTDFYVKKI